MHICLINLNEFNDDNLYLKLNDNLQDFMSLYDERSQNNLMKTIENMKNIKNKLTNNNLKKYNKNEKLKDTHTILFMKTNRNIKNIENPQNALPIFHIICMGYSNIATNYCIYSV